MTDTDDRRLFARAKKRALGVTPLFELSKEAREALAALRMHVSDDLERLQEQWDRRTRSYREQDPDAVCAWVEDVEGLADMLENFAEAAPQQFAKITAAVREMSAAAEGFTGSQPAPPR